jgi:hypothetical protein
MNRINSAVIGLVAAISLETSAYAQTAYSAVPQWHGRWRASSSTPTYKPVTIHANLPVECDDEAGRAAATWNGAQALLRYSAPQVTALDEVPPESPYNLQKVYLREGDLEDGVLMRASWDSVASSTSGLPTIYGVIIRVNTDNLYYGADRTGNYYCGSPDALDNTEFDYESVLFHELGHSFGFRHGADPNCPMYPSVIRGASRRVPCPDEAQSFRDLYDPKVTPY